MENKVLKGTLAFGLATMISRVTGLLRDAFFAGYFGTSNQYDAYLVAIMIPFFLRKIFAEGALSLTFVPMFVEKRRESIERAFEFASTVLLLVISVTSIISVTGVVFSTPVTRVFAGGFDPEVILLTSKLMKITFPFVLLVSTWSVFYGVLNSFDAYFLAALSPAFINLSTITGIALSRHFNPPILGPTIAFVVGGGIQVLAVITAAKKKGFRFKARFNKKDAREFLKIFGLTMISPAIAQVNSLVDTRVATELGSGAVSSLQYAMRLYQLPLGIFGISVATVVLAELSKYIKNTEKFNETLWTSLETLLYFILPATLGLIVLSKEIVSLLFQRGAFSYIDTLNTARILRIYAVGLPFYGLFNIFSRVHYSRQNPRFPSLIAALMAGINIVLDIVLGLSYGPVGIAWATAIAGIFGFLSVSLQVLLAVKATKSQLYELLKITMASLIMAITLFIERQLLPAMNLSSIIEVLSGVAIYLLLSKLFALREYKYIKGVFKRR
ncbi:MAG: murein biosynthesis integral membrane protein MurJ [Kosmotoga sp.]|uniref:murein biosynthesis integral membrane protein MurJ n=1 Tax=Kosmotoga sp. TaxID=1955248 RepID=UPI0025B80031|nr:murein biosynthesis integral membrane protein MurJ [Kosmotoga sp.]MCD6159214.1 murein biosynthesis integral membrane protein MurJ [Kosmotoga sp.]